MRPWLDYPRIPTAKYTRASRKGADLIVIHTMEAPEKPGTARAVAKWFADEGNKRKASAHFCVDNAETIQCVALTEVAWHAGGANHNGIGIEHAGYAKQAIKDWHDLYSMNVLERSAQLAALLCREAGIPVVRVTATDLRAGGARGFCGHVDVSKAFQKSDHWDPGPSFPWESYLARVAELVASAADTDPAPPPSGAIETPLPTLRRGDQGEAVRDLQARLNARGQLPQLLLDGVFGLKTELAVKDYQRARALVPDGVVGDRTWHALTREDARP